MHVFSKIWGFAKVCQPSDSRKLIPAKLNFEGRRARKFVPAKVSTFQVFQIDCPMQQSLGRSYLDISSFLHNNIADTTSRAMVNPFCLCFRFEIIPSKKVFGVGDWRRVYYLSNSVSAKNLLWLVCGSGHREVVFQVLSCVYYCT